MDLRNPACSATKHVPYRDTDQMWPRCVRKLTADAEKKTKPRTVKQMGPTKESSGEEQISDTLRPPPFWTSRASPLPGMFQKSRDGSSHILSCLRTSPKFIPHSVARDIFSECKSGYFTHTHTPCLIPFQSLATAPRFSPNFLPRHTRGCHGLIYLSLQPYLGPASSLHVLLSYSQCYPDPWTFAHAIPPTWRGFFFPLWVYMYVCLKSHFLLYIFLYLRKK